MKLRLSGLLAFFLLTGCISAGGGVPVPVKHYALEYPPPRVEGRSAVDGAVRIEPFVLAQDSDSRDMIYRPRPYARETYRHHRWNVPPVLMIHGLVLRDIRQSGLFGAVLSPEEEGQARYILDGRIEEFLEIDEADRSVATVVIGVTLFDKAAADGGGKIFFQKTYRSSEPLGRRQADELARAMSAAMAKFSGELLKDLASVVATHGKK